ncbi:hypothetical protein, partial [Guyparkeria sp.]|uniref:hypothetical protein n=1 Tax=Guyparkeria sp. TaxID=2035736 RepID=UPI003970A01F
HKPPQVPDRDFEVIEQGVSAAGQRATLPKMTSTPGIPTIAGFPRAFPLNYLAAFLAGFPGPIES